MRRTDTSELTGAATAGPAQSIEVVDAEIATTWPSFGRTGIDWDDLGDRLRPAGDDPDVVAHLQHWVAQLGDAHTNVHATSDVAALPYSARVIDGRLMVADVPSDTAAWHAGVRAGALCRDRSGSRCSTWYESPIGRLVRSATRRANPRGHTRSNGAASIPAPCTSGSGAGPTPTKR